MKILIDARESGTSTGRYIDKLIENLHHLRPQHQIVIATKSSRLKFMCHIAPGFEAIAADFQELSVFDEQWRFYLFLKQQQADVVHFGMVQQPLLYSLFGGPKVTTMMDLTTLRFTNPAKNWPLFKLKQLVYLIINLVAVRTSSRVITISQFTAKDIARGLHVQPTKFRTTYLAADRITAPAEAINSLANQPFLFYIGRSLPHKNLARLVEAYQLLQAKNPDLKLVLAGKKDVLYQQLEQYASRHGVQPIFTDFVSEGQLRWLYQQAQAYIFPSLSEGFGLPGLEAMAHGCPVVSSNASCLPEVYGSACVYFDPSQPQAMADQIQRLINKPTLRRQLIARGHKRVQRFSWRTTAQQTLAVYEEVLMTRSR